LLYFYHTW